jgi:hypothetical protein
VVFRWATQSTIDKSNRLVHPKLSFISIFTFGGETEPFPI